MKEIRISDMEAGQRLDRMLERYLPGAGKSFLYKMLRKKNITLNGKKAQGNEKLQSEDIVRIWFSQETLDHFAEKGSDRPENQAGLETAYPSARLDILYEDEHVLMVSKRAGMLSQKAKESDISLCEYLIGYLIRSGQIKPEQLRLFKPSVCNRLDTGTSGIVCCGKTIAGLQALSAAFRDRLPEKYYYALVLGKLTEPMHLEGYLIKDEQTNRVRVTDRAGNGARRIVTDTTSLSHGSVRVKGKPVPLTLLKVHLITGRSHQIRAHLASVSHPIAGDMKYAQSADCLDMAEAFGLHSQLLHCGLIRFPVMEGVLSSLSEMEIQAPLPEMFAAFLKQAGMPLPRQ